MAKTERSGHTTTDHDFIRRWVEERGGWPARVVGTGGENDAGLIRIDFPGFSGEGSLEQIEWDEWFEGFEANQLAFLHRDMDHGGGDLDRFNKLISRGDEDGGEEGEGGGEGSGSRSAAAKKSTRASSSKSEGAAARKSASAGESARKAGGGSARQAASTAETGAKASGKARASGTGSSGSGGDGAGNTELRALLLHDLGDLLSAERQFLVTTRALAREAQDPEVRARTEEHVTETEGQIQRLNEAFAAVGERPRAVRCEAAAGLKEEHDSYKKEEKPSKQLLSAFGLGSGLRVEHYEIAAYRSAIALAGALGEKECAQLLNESLREEMAMASFLEKTSKTLLRRMASGQGAGEGASASGGSSTAKRASSARGGSSAGKGASGRGGRGGTRG